MTNVSQGAGAASGSVTARVVPWASRRRRFAANVQALAQRDAVGAELVQAAGAKLEQFELYAGADGNYFVRDIQVPGAAGWLGGMANHKAAENLWQYDRSKTPLPRPMVFDGLGYGWLFFKVLSTTERTYVNYSCAVYVLEGDPAALAMLFYMHDLQDIIAHPRTRWYVRSSGAEALAAFREALEARRDWTVAEQFVRCQLRPREQLPIEQTIQKLISDRAKQRDALIAQAAAYYGDKDAAYWRQRFAEATHGGEKLRVLGITSRYTTVLQYSMAEMKTAVEAAGCEMRVAIEPDDHSTESDFVEQSAEFKPDLILVISRMRYENPYLPRNVPFLCWDQDSLPCMRTPEATASLDALTYVAGYGAIYGFNNLKWPRENCIFVHQAAATFRNHAGPADAALLAKHACDISFVSNASETPEAMAARLRVSWPAGSAYTALFDRATGLVRRESESGGTFEFLAMTRFLRTVATEMNVALEDRAGHEMAVQLTAYADRTFRHTTLGWVSRWCTANGKTLRLYGRGWEHHAEFRQWAAGIAEPGEETRAIFQASRINLQIIETGFIHSRALDGLSSGGFFLTRQTPADGTGSAADIVQTMYEMARWAVDNGVTSEETFGAVTDAVMREKVEKVREHCQKLGRPEALWILTHVWAETPPASILFPQIAAITFHNEKSFAELAEKYLADNALRASVAKEMRANVLEKFSYQARWKTFLRGIMRGLDGAAAANIP